MRIEPCDLYCPKDFKRLLKRYPEFSKSFERAERLLRDHFMNVGNPIGSKSLILLHSKTIYGVKLEIYKFKIAVPNLRPGQYPRLWFGYIADQQILIPAAIAAHQDGYSDAQIEHSASQNLEDYIDTRITSLY